MQLCRQHINGNSKLSVSSSEAELCLYKVSVKSLNAAADSGENSNLVLSKLRVSKWAKDEAAVTCSLLMGREDASFIAPVHHMALDLYRSFNCLVIPYGSGKEDICPLLLLHLCMWKHEMRLFPGFMVWWGHTGQHAGQAALLLYVSELWNRAQLYWPSVCLLKLCTINGSASWDWNHNPQGTSQQIWFEFQVAMKYETRWVSCGLRFC